MIGIHPDEIEKYYKGFKRNEDGSVEGETQFEIDYYDWGKQYP